MEKKNNSEQTTNSSFSINEFLKVCASHWITFLCSIIIFCSIGALYILRKQPMYNRSSQVLIQDQDLGGSPMIDVAGAVSSFGLFGGNTQVNNEVIAMQSPAVMGKVVDRLDLTMNYAQRIEFFHRTTVYGTDLPFRVKFLDLAPQEIGGFRMIVRPDGSFDLDKFYTFDTKLRKLDFTTTGKLDQPIKSPLGRIKIYKNPVYSGKYDEEFDIKVAKGGFQETITDYLERLTVELVNDDAEVIGISFDDYSVERSVDVLNTLLAAYNEEYFANKKQVSSTTSKFIEDRIKILERELGEVDSNIFSYKSEHVIPDVAAAVEIYMTEAAKQDSEIQEIRNKLAMTSFVKEYMLDPANKYQVLPVNTGIESPQLEIEIGNYNDMLLARNSVAANSSETNPLVEDYDKRLKGLRESVLRSVNMNLSQLQAALKNMDSSMKQSQNKIANAPNQANYLISIERKQAVMEQLYLFLLQKREETEFSQAFSTFNTRIISPPFGPIKPVSPKKPLIILGCFMLGLIIPAAYYYLQMSSDTRISKPSDIEGTLPDFIGQIPFAGKKKRFAKLFSLLMPKKNSAPEKYQPLDVVGNDDNILITEAFDQIGSNLRFLTENQSAPHSLMFTSFKHDSGKTFVTFNLGLSLALKNNRVLLIDADLRRGALSTFVGSPANGLADYLAGNHNNWRELIVTSSESGNLSVIPVGHIAPNSTELLENGRFSALLEQIGENYDYILIDSPVADVDVDASIISQRAERSVFVIRAGVLDKADTQLINDTYDSGKFRNMSIILNAVEK